MKVALVRPLLSADGFNGYPLNLLILAAAIREVGHQPALFDYDYLKELDSSWDSPDFSARAAEEILSCQPDVVGITSMCSNYVLAVDLSNEIKKRAPHVHITFGGPHVSLCALETLESFPAVDTCVLGEGEVTFPALLQCLEHQDDLSPILGIAYRDANGTPVKTSPRPLMKDITLSPRPAYDLVDMQSYINTSQDVYMQVYTGSGCPFDCSFCSTSLVWERKYRVMGAQRVVDEIEYLHKTYNVTHFNLIHDNLTSNKAYIHGIAEEITRRHLKINWGYSSRIDTLDERTCQITAAAGCNYIFFGVESASEKIQKVVRKRLKVPMIHKTLRHCLENGILPTTSFILGFPEEEREDIEATIRLAYACKINGVWRSFINLLSPYTGTSLMRNSTKLILNWDYLNTSMSSFLYDRHKQEIAKNPYIYANFYFLDYAQSYLNEHDYSLLVDFYTMCLFKYPFTISYLINDLGISPLTVFERFRSMIKAIPSTERYALKFTLKEEDFQELVEAERFYDLSSVLLYDQSIVQTSQSKAGSRLLYQGSAFLPDAVPENLLEQPVVMPGTRYFLQENAVQQVATYELTCEQYEAFLAQGVPSLRSRYSQPSNSINEEILHA